MSPKSMIKVRTVESLAEHLQEVDNRVRNRAYERYLQRGALPGREFDDWCDACSDLMIEPPIAVCETDTHVLVLFFFPNADMSSLELLVTDRGVILQSAPHPAVDFPGTVHVREFHPRQVFRFVPLPRTIVPTSATVDYDGSVLRVRSIMAGAALQAADKTPKPRRTRTKATAG